MATWRSAPRVGARRRGLAGSAEESVEDVAEAAEGAEALEAAIAAHGAIEAGVAEAVVGLALLRVGEHLVGLVDLLELRLCAGLRVAVRVVLHRQAAERALDLVLGGVLTDA